MVDDALRWFVEFMDSGRLSDIGPFLVAVPLGISLLVVVHELGHAAVALACADGVVVVRVGRFPGALQGRFGRLHFSFDLHPGESEEGWTEVDAELTRGESLASALAGPGANVALALLLVPTVVALSGVWSWFVGALAAASAYIALANLFSRDPASDGQHALAALRERGADSRPP